jgi:hypothetical protein
MSLTAKSARRDSELIPFPELAEREPASAAGDD